MELLIVSGFLGAGKTTLIKKMLASPPAGTRLAVIENEFGQINIDGTVLKQSGIPVREITHGCICCTLVDNFCKTLQHLKTDFDPDTVIIEPSGVARIEDILKTLTASQIPGLSLGPVITAVDAVDAPDYLDGLGAFYRNQIQNAGCIALSHLDECDAAEGRQIIRRIHLLNPEATLLTTPLPQLTPPTLWQALCGQSDASPVPPVTFSDGDLPALGLQNLTFISSHPFSESGLRQCLSQLFQMGSPLYRAKGSVPCVDGGWLFFDYIPKRLYIHPEEHLDDTGFCVIGKDLQAGRIQTLLKAAAPAPSEDASHHHHHH